MSIKYKRASVVAWLLFGMIAIMATFGMIYSLEASRDASRDIFTQAGSVLWGLIPVVFAFLAALILSRQPRNLIGWLLMLPAIALANDSASGTYFSNFISAPSNPSLAFLLSFWFYGWSWLLLIFPIFFILMLFPNGQPLSPRWRWAVYYAFGVCMVFFLLIAFSQPIGRNNTSWSLENPVGFIPASWIDKYGIFPLLGGLLSLTILSVTSIIVRYRRKSAIEREQIKWLLYACLFFAAVYVISILLNLQSAAWGAPGMWFVLGPISLMTIPLAIAIAILRYRLWDIDVIIRRTLVYGALTLTLGLVYFGSVVLLQSLVTAVGGQQSAVITVISTLLIAALFTPLRRRIQNDIDRRFYRKKYDAEKTIAAFSAGLRQEVDLYEMSERLLAVVEETMQPVSVSLWLKPTASSKMRTYPDRPIPEQEGLRRVDEGAR